MVLTLEVANSEPFIPTNDRQVLERLRAEPPDPITREIRHLRKKLTDCPYNLQSAVLLSKLYIEQGRRKSDPRYLGYAQNVLTPWLDKPQPSPTVLILSATIRQSLHDFDGALKDLNLVLKTEPNNPQALVTKAIILQVQGKYSEAKRCCIPLLRLSSRLVAVTCLCSVSSLNGEADKSFKLLQQTLENTPAPRSDERLWALTVLAEIAVRTGNNQAAEKYFKEALVMDITDNYLLCAYSDFLLDQNRFKEVLTLLKNHISIDNLLLRLAIAEQNLRVSNLKEHISFLKSRFTASRMRGDSIHLREEALFTLKLLKQPRVALELSLENWVQQRESWDARIVMESALAANNPDAALPVLKWLEMTGLEDVQLELLSKQIKTWCKR